MNPRQTLVVVDGSNLATEGRTTPSLAQLQECVAAFVVEQPTAKTVVVVDATFGHRIAVSERARFKELELQGELVTPPAGAIGRGDAFILKIASRSNAIVLSNDSFQEFQAEHAWLFEPGRLIGGKPVRGIGWVFTARLPVRAPKPRVAAAPRTAKAAATPRQPAKSAAKQPAKKSQDKPPARKATKAAKGPTKPPAAAATPQKRARPAASTAAPARRAAKSPAAAPAEPRRRSRRRAASPTPSAPAKATKTHRSTAAPAKATKAAPAAKATKAGAADKPSPTTRDDSPVNSVRAFRAMTSRHAARDVVEGEVASFTSHGAMISVTVGRGTKVSCYVPLKGLGRPAPTRARDVLKLGERRSFRISSYDEDRRIAQLSLVAG